LPIVRSPQCESAMNLSIDLNCDMGESYGAYAIGDDGAVVPFITSANVACGFHASDPSVMDRTVRLCRDHSVRVGAHPGFPDRAGFGRRFMDIDEKDLINDLVYQVGALKGFLDLHGLPLQHVKLHGALYNHLVNQEDLFMKIARTLGRAFAGPVFLTLATRRTTALKQNCRREGLRIGLEAFPDRSYTDEGELLSRKLPGAVFHDPGEIARRATDMILRRGVESIGGRWIELDIDTLCLHGDNAESIEAAAKIHESCRLANIRMKPLADFL
jgi:UPF0271 protein